MKTVIGAFILAVMLGGGSYQRLSPADEARFFQSGASAFLGFRVHLHLPPAPFMSPPKKVRPTVRSPVFHQYTYRNVKFLVDPANPYYQQVRRKRMAGKIVCLKGRVRQFTRKTGPSVLIHRIRGITKPRQK